MKILGILLILFCMLTVSAQQQEQAVLVTIEGKTYQLHEVKQGETLFSICKKYQIEQKELVAANPQLINGLKHGSELRIPLALKQYTPDPLVFAAVDSNENSTFFFHTVEQGDTFYAYKRRFGVSKEALLKYNPQLSDGLKVGLQIKVPAEVLPAPKVVSFNSGALRSHEVKKGETLYSISRKYGVGILEIKDINPELKYRGLINGENISIPDPENQQVKKGQKSVDVQVIAPVVSQESPQKNTALSELPPFQSPSSGCKPLVPGTKVEPLRVAMFLPLFFDRNRYMNLQEIDEQEISYLQALKSKDPLILKKYFRVVYDPVSKTRDTLLLDSLAAPHSRSLYPATRSILSFYEGVLLALDSLERSGVKVRLDLYDTQNKQEKIATILNQHDFIETDLIIGPVDLELQSIVSAFSAKNRIPMVSPFFNSDVLLESNPYFIQVNPTKEYLMRKTSDFIGDAYYNKNFVILTLGSYTQLKEFDLVRMVRDKFFRNGIYHNLDNILFTQVDFTEGGTMGYWQVKKTLRSDMENVIFIPATDKRDEREALLSRAINSLNVLAEEFDITLIGVSDYPRFKSINTEYFHRLKLHYLTPNYVDYDDDAVNRFIGKYRQHFNAEPDMLSFRGYDLMMYFASAHARYGKHSLHCLGAFQFPLLQSDYNFQKVSELGGYMNHTLYIVQYTNDYRIKVKDTITEGRMP
ncbi:MAG: LysM peptidoglycan-binding domain-containing protein [Prolixibacteraceae bacterium]|nr:LysM peptidoglycan-binding domain-containing protein [Prolixibacteraceae bacterium]